MEVSDEVIEKLTSEDWWREQFEAKRKEQSEWWRELHELVPSIRLEEQPPLFERLRHPLHHTKYIIVTLVVNTFLFPVEHMFWADVIGWTP